MSNATARLWEGNGKATPAAAPTETPSTTIHPTSSDAGAALVQAIRAIGGDNAATAHRIEQLEAKVEAISQQAPQVYRFAIGDQPAGKPIPGARPELAKIVRRIAAGARNVWMTGPAGSGKTTLAHHVADALGRPFGFQSFAADSTAASLIGGPNAAGVYQETAFIDAYEKGGVYLLDEIDAAPAEILVAINAALANGHLSLPRHHDPARRVIVRHPDTIIIAAANTWGTGPTAQYMGRGHIDAATTNRFATARFTVGYDKATEKALCPHDETRELVYTLRHATEALGVRQIVSMREIIGAAQMHAAGYDAAEILEALTTGWTDQEKAKAGAA